MSSGGGHTITGGNDFVGRVPREGHAGGKEGGSVSQASFGRFIASASRSVPVLEKQRPPRLQPRVYMRPAEASEMVMSKHWLRRLHTALVALALGFVPLGVGVNAADDQHKVAVVSFGLFGDQRVFQSEATGA